MARNWALRFFWICFVSFSFLAKMWIFCPLWAGAEEGPVLMDEVIVTATKTTEKRKDIPNAVILMDEADIQASPAKSLGEILANELGIDWRTRGNYGGASQEIHIRGMGGDATHVFVNGVSVNSPSLGTADLGRIPLNNIERIEVVKGSGSLLYGSGAMGGTINIITKRPKRDKIDAKVSAGYGSQDTCLVSAEHGGMFTFGDLGYYLTANQRKSDGFRDNSDLTHQDVSLNLVLDKGDHLDISLYGDYIDREYGRPGVEPPPGTQDYYINEVIFYNSDVASLIDHGTDEDGHVVLQIKSKPVEWLSLNFRGDYTCLENYNYDRYHSSGKGKKTWTINEVTGIEGNIEIKPFEGANFLLGAEYKDYDWKNENVDLDTNGAEVAGTRSKTKADLHTKGIFAEIQYRPCKYFKALAGIRHEDHSTFGYEDLPRFGLIVNPLKNTVLKFSRGKHFKAPTPNDLFWPYEDWGWGMGAEGNPNLKPETGWHADATAEQTFFDEKVFITLSCFKWNIDDKISWVPDSNFFYRPQNLDSYEADGWELGTKIGPFYNLILALSYTNTDAEETKKGGARRQARYTPDDQFKGSLTYWTELGLNATTTVRYVGKRPGMYDNDTDINPSRTLASYWTTDIKIEQRLYDHWILSLTGNNLFDKGYETYVQTFYDSTGTATLCPYPGAGRSVFFGATYEY
ncbi:MAG: TonB-dependent receptor [Desulfobacterales bacterium]|nr:TonB-dependent receptor [Desulfobacterales bacterium]